MRRISATEMKQIELEIVDEIHRICKEHNLQYFLAFGSLIGAMRHQGFIPWDDDTDLLMFREDYTQLVRHFDEWKSSDRFAIVAPELGNSPYHFAKIYDSRTIMKQTYLKDEYTTGVWVDIFTLDWFDPNNQLTLRKIRRLVTLRYLAAMNPQAPSSSPMVSMARRVVGAIFSHVDPKVLAARIDELAQEQCTTPTNAVTVVFSIDKKMERIYRKEWFEPILVPFEDREYYAPREYDLLLTTRYGNWREPVPEEAHSSDAFML